MYRFLSGQVAQLNIIFNCLNDASLEKIKHKISDTWLPDLRRIRKESKLSDEQWEKHCKKWKRIYEKVKYGTFGI